MVDVDDLIRLRVTPAETVPWASFRNIWRGEDARGVKSTLGVTAREERIDRSLTWPMRSRSFERRGGHAERWQRSRCPTQQIRRGAAPCGAGWTTDEQSHRTFRSRPFYRYVWKVSGRDEVILTVLW